DRAHEVVDRRLALLQLAARRLLVLSERLLRELEERRVVAAQRIGGQRLEGLAELRLGGAQDLQARRRRAALGLELGRQARLCRLCAGGLRPCARQLVAQQRDLPLELSDALGTLFDSGAGRGDVRRRARSEVRALPLSPRPHDGRRAPGPGERAQHETEEDSEEDHRASPLSILLECLCRFLILAAIVTDRAAPLPAPCPAPAGRARRAAIARCADS